MEPYLFSGKILPERAQLDLQFSVNFTHHSTDANAVMSVNIILNQLAVWVESSDVWDIFTLRNVVKTTVQNELAKISYIKGYAYELDVTRVINRELNIDYVFGVGIPILEDRGKEKDLNLELVPLREVSEGSNGILMNRCFSDLSSAMKHADDTAFYCYRAIESLFNHSIILNNLTSASANDQWSAFRKVAGCKKDDIMNIKDDADPLRHGKPTTGSSDDRAQLFYNTWNIVEGYIAGLKQSTLR